MLEQVPDTLEPTAPRLILVVDDEPRMIRFIRMNLEDKIELSESEFEPDI